MVVYEIPDSVLRLLPPSEPPVLPPRHPPQSNNMSKQHRENKYEFLIEQPPEPSRKRLICCKPLCCVCILIVTLLIGLLFLVIAGHGPDECPPGYKYWGKTQHCYKINHSPVTFDKAKASCESEEAHLASVHSKEENDFLNSFYYSDLTENIKNHGRSNVWLGLVYLNDKWQWTDGTPFDYPNWAKREPSNMDFEHWAVMIVEKHPNWSDEGNEWNNIAADWKHAFFCKKPAKSLKMEYRFTTIAAPTLPPKTTKAPTTTAPTTTTISTKKPVLIPKCSSGYTYFEKTGFCYKCSVKAVNFEIASSACAAEDADLISIHSEAESDFAINLYRERLASHRLTEDLLMKRSDVWIGFVFNNKTKDWSWTDGSEVDYRNWAPGEPNIMNKEQHWSVLVLDESEDYNPEGNKWNNIGNTNSRAFICKKPDIFSKKRVTARKPTTLKAKESTSGNKETTPTSTSTKEPVLIPKCSSGYTYFEKTGFCYKAYSKRSTFEEAKSTCASETAHLTSIHSEEENNYVIKLARESFDRNEDTYAYRHRVWTGLVFSKDTKKWGWEDGSEVDYTNWMEDEPNWMDTEQWTSIVIETYAVTNPHGTKWNNQVKEYQEAFVCKQKAM